MYPFNLYCFWEWFILNINAINQIKTNLRYIWTHFFIINWIVKKFPSHSLFCQMRFQFLHMYYWFTFSVYFFKRISILDKLLANYTKIITSKIPCHPSNNLQILYSSFYSTPADPSLEYFRSGLCCVSIYFHQHYIICEKVMLLLQVRFPHSTIWPIS